MEEGFKIEDLTGVKDGMSFDRKVTFYHDKTGEIEAEYYYSKGKVNYLLSWGFFIFIGKNKFRWLITTRLV